MATSCLGWGVALQPEASNIMSAPMIEIKRLSKVYQQDELKTTVLKHIDFKVYQGEFVAIMGPSGSGKSTLMHILGGLDLPSSGSYRLDGQEVNQLSDDALAEIRNRRIGFVFQAFNLLPRTSALDNVRVPMEYADLPDSVQITKATELLTLVGLSDRLHHPPNKLSGGQQQRVAIARALVMDPAIILADEPTGNIASKQAAEIMDLFHQLHRQGHTIVMITHEEDIAEHAERIVHLHDGVMVETKK